MDKAPMDIDFSPQTLICTIVLGVIALIVIAMNKED